MADVFVLELSSFQLETTSSLAPVAAAVLNVTDNHLDRYAGIDDYAAAKARIFVSAGIQVLNRDEPRSLAMRIPGRPVESFGASVPAAEGEWGLVQFDRVTWLAHGGGLLVPTDSLALLGRHNALNALAALALADAIGCPLAPMLHALREYRGEPHRVEHVASIDGIDAFDDSKGTNVGATEAALIGLGSERAPAKLVVILGGDGKGQDFAPLAAPLTRYARAAFTIGRDAAAIEPIVDRAGVPFERFATLEAAVRAAFARAQPGDAVLLSPACASLDMFRNYAHRAEVFVSAVKAIAADIGSVEA